MKAREFLGYLEKNINIEEKQHGFAILEAIESVNNKEKKNKFYEGVKGKTIRKKVQEELGMNYKENYFERVFEILTGYKVIVTRDKDKDKPRIDNRHYNVGSHYH